MSLTVPSLDDRTYRDLVAEAFHVIEAGDGDWTNRNPSDPGVTLVELLAYFTEMLIYRLNQIGDADRRAFARLLDPSAGERGDQPADDQLRHAITRAQRRERVVSCADFEAAALAASAGVARAYCVPNRDLTQASAAARRADRPGHLTVLIVPAKGADAYFEEVLEVVEHDLDERRLLGTRVHVGRPSFIEVRVRLTIVTVPGAAAGEVKRQAESVLARHFDPVSGGPDGEGWPLGRRVFISEIYQLLDRLPGVDYVTRSIDPGSGARLDEIVVADETRLERGGGELIAMRLEPFEAVRFIAAPDLLQVTRTAPEMRMSAESEA